MRTAIYPGSFDPLTNGHLDVIERAVKALRPGDRGGGAGTRANSRCSPWKNAWNWWRGPIQHLPNVEADSLTACWWIMWNNGGAQAVMRGLRAVSDFEFEFQLALMNRKLNERIETIFMMPKDTYTFLSSRIVKEIARLGRRRQRVCAGTRADGPDWKAQDAPAQSGVVMPLL